MAARNGEFVQEAGPFLTAALASYGDQVLTHEEVASKSAVANIGLRLLQATARRVDAKGRDALQTAVEEATEEPENEDASATLRQQIRRAVRNDPDLGRELAALLPADGRGAGVTVIAAGDRSVAAGGNIGTVITGDGVRRPPKR